MSGLAAPDAAPKATVAIPVYNSAATLERCIRSAMRQSRRDIEILVADDCSTDGSAAVADGLAAQDPRIRVVRLAPNGGKPKAMNQLVAMARGEWVAVLDADDAFGDDRLERLITAAEAAGVQMAADNIWYVDGGADQVVQTGFASGAPPCVITKQDLIAHSDSYAEFDFGILKPVIRRAFLLENGLTYYEQARLAEDFYYLMNFFVAGGRGVLVSEPHYYWTMPFGTFSRQWTTTGSGAWRYDYRRALACNEHFIAEMARRGHADMVSMLQARSRQYQVMIHYLDAQRAASEGKWGRCVATILGHPNTYPLLLGRIWGRIRRGISRRPATAPDVAHPSLRPLGLAQETGA